MSRSKLLIIDAVINFVLGILLLLIIPFPEQITQFLGVPKVQQVFYPSIMGGVFIGVGIALLIESRREKHQHLVGLGLVGAAAINLCGGFVLMGWLLFGELNLPMKGYILLWVITILLVGISSIELAVSVRKKILP